MNDVVNEVMNIIGDINDSSKRGPTVCLICMATSDESLVYQGMIEDWSIDLHSEEDVKRFGIIINSIYEIGEWS